MSMSNKAKIREDAISLTPMTAYFYSTSLFMYTSPAINTKKGNRCENPLPIFVLSRVVP